MPNYRVIGNDIPEGIDATLRTNEALSQLIVEVDGHEIGLVGRDRLARPKADGSGGTTSRLRWCAYSRGWAPKDWPDALFEGPPISVTIGDDFDDRMSAAVSLLHVWDRAGRPIPQSTTEGNSDASTTEDPDHGGPAVH